MAGVNQDEYHNPVEFITEVIRVKGLKSRRSGKGLSFRCPSHGDKENSAALYRGKDGGAVLKCFAGCDTQSLCDALGIRKRDLFPSNGFALDDGIIEAYKYFDSDGVALLYEHLRMKPTRKNRKPFYYRRFDDSGNSLWTLGEGWFQLNTKRKKWERIKDADDPSVKPQANARWFDESPRVLYWQSRIKSAPPGALVIYCEGEKDVHTAEGMGFIATTAGAAGDWREEFAEDLRGPDLIVIPDNDQPGLLSALKVAADCYGKASRVRIVELPGLAEKGDLTDWRNAGGTRDKLLELINDTPDFIPAEEASEDEAVEIEGDDPPITSDPKRERWLRQTLRNRAKVEEAITLLLNKLGFMDLKSRLLRLRTALDRIAPDRLSTITAAHQWIAAKYPGGGMSVSTVARDIDEWLTEEKRLGVEILGYTHGTMNPATGQGYASKFKRLYLRYALQAINLAIETRGDLEYSHDALSRACDEIVKSIPRVPVEPVMADESDSDGADLHNDPVDKETLKMKHSMKVSKAIRERWGVMRKDGLNLDEIIEAMNDGFNDAQAWGVQQMSDSEDYKENDSSLLNYMDRMVGSSEPEMGPHIVSTDDEYMGEAETPLDAPGIDLQLDTMKCDYCSDPVPVGADQCPNLRCGATYSPRYWRLNYDLEVSSADD